MKHNFLQIFILTILVLCGIVFAYMWYGAIGTKPDDKIVQEKVHTYFELWSYDGSAD